MKGADCEAEQPSTQAFRLMSNFCQFPALTAKKCFVYVDTVPFFDNISTFSHYLCTELSEFVFFCLVWLHNGPKIFLFDRFNWNYCVTAILGAKLLLYSTFFGWKVGFLEFTDFQVKNSLFLDLERGNRKIMSF